MRDNSMLGGRKPVSVGWGCGHKLALVLVVLVWAAGCAGVTPTCRVPTTVELEIETSDRVNVDGEGQSLPTVIRLYQLKDLSALQTSTFEDVWEQPEQSLGATLVSSEELVMYPGQVGVRRFERDESADFLVAVAIFRSPVGSSWRSIEEWPLPGDPCQERNDQNAAPTLSELRVRAFIQDYRIESVNNYAQLPRRGCAKDDPKCLSDSGGDAPDELGEELRHRRLRTFEEDTSRPRPTSGQPGYQEGGP